MMKIINEETILVAQPPKYHEAHQIYEDIGTNALAQLQSVYGRPYTIKRIQIGESKTGLAANTNSLILNPTVYVPMFDIELDSLAIEKWQEILPSFEIKGFTFHWMMNQRI